MSKLRKRKREKKREYINKKEFFDVIVECKETGELSKRAIELFQILANEAINGLYYSDSRDREDCIQSALYDLLKYWRNFNPTISNNAFSFYTQIAVNGYAKEFNKIHKHKIEFVSLDFSGESEIYTI